MDKKEIRDVYDDLAPWYDFVEGIPDRLLGSHRLRREIVGRARGRVLEVAMGTGKNLSFYPRGCSIVGVDLSRRMMEGARDRARRRDGSVPLVRMDAELLGFLSRFDRYFE